MYIIALSRKLKWILILKNSIARINKSINTKRKKCINRIINK